MMSRALLIVTYLTIGAAVGLAGQQPAPRQPPPPSVLVAPQVLPTPPPPPPPPQQPRRLGQPVNVRVEFTITDQRGKEPAIKRTVSVIVADGEAGRIRSQSEVLMVPGGVTLNVDTSPEILSDGKVRLGFALQYDWPAPVDMKTEGTRGTVTKTEIRDNLSLILESGKPIVAAQSADAIGDRQVSVEVRATILR